jgi:hypothetical protein
MSDDGFTRVRRPVNIILTGFGHAFDGRPSRPSSLIPSTSLPRKMATFLGSASDSSLHHVTNTSTSYVPPEIVTEISPLSSTRVTSGDSDNKTPNGNGNSAQDMNDDESKWIDLSSFDAFSFGRTLFEMISLNAPKKLTIASTAPTSSTIAATTMATTGMSSSGDGLHCRKKEEAVLQVSEIIKQMETLISTSRPSCRLIAAMIIGLLRSDKKKNPHRDDVDAAAVLVPDDSSSEGKEGESLKLAKAANAGHYDATNMILTGDDGRSLHVGSVITLMSRLNSHKTEGERWTLMACDVIFQKLLEPFYCVTCQHHHRRRVE